MNRRDFLKVLRDASVAVPAMAITGDTKDDEEQAQSAAEIEVVPVTCEKPPSLSFNGDTMVFSATRVEVFTQGRWKQL